MLQIETENSTYLIDQDNKRVKRVEGRREPTNYQAMADESGWKPYEEFREVDGLSGKYMVFIWLHAPVTPGADTATTQTSLIKSRQEV